MTTIDLIETLATAYARLPERAVHVLIALFIDEIDEHGWRVSA